MTWALSYRSTLSLCRARIITPGHANVIEIIDGQPAIDSRKDLKSRQVAKILSELNIGQFAVLQSWAWWYGNISENGPRRGNEFISVDGKLTIRRPFVLAPNPERKDVEPKRSVRRSWTGAELSNQLKARVRGPVDVQAYPSSIDCKLWR